MKQPKAVPEQQLGAPIRMTGEGFATSMRKLLQNEDFKNLRAQWVNLRAEILEAGKKRKTVELWAVLEGFDFAVMEPERWASYKPRSEDMKKRQDELLSILEGTK